MTTKLGWPYSPAEAGAQLRSQASAATDSVARRRLLHAARNVELGNTTLVGAQRALETAGRATRQTATLADKLVFSPAGAIGRSALRGAGIAGQAILESPTALAMLGAGALSAPIILRDTERVYDQTTEGILQARQDPRRIVEEPTGMTDLDTFLEKKSAFISPAVSNPLRDSAILGFGSGMGSELAKGVLFGAGRGVSSLHSALFGNSEKEQILKKLMTTDQIISDALKRSPAAKEQLLEAYATLEKFAPTLATDINAVRSFLREVVLGGGHVNYATIKNLIETEKSLHGELPKYKGIL